MGTVFLKIKPLCASTLSNFASLYMTFTYREVAKFDNSANDFLGTDEMSVALKSFEATAGW